MMRMRNNCNDASCHTTTAMMQAVAQGMQRRMLACYKECNDANWCVTNAVQTKIVVDTHASQSFSSVTLHQREIRTETKNALQIYV